MAPSQQFIPGGWSDREIEIGGKLFRLWTPTDPDEVLGQIESPEAAAQPHLADPYWAKLWPAAPLLAAAIVQYPLPTGTRMLELGCGSGLTGIAALSCGLDVTFSDYVPLAVELALENATRNGFPEAKGTVLDWRHTLDEKFAFIAAADVTYDRANLDPLLNVLDQMLAPDGVAWFGDAGRSPATDFIERAKNRGWRVTLFDEQDRPASDTVLGSYRRIVLKHD